MRGKRASLDRELLRHAIEVEQLTQAAAAVRFGVSTSCVERSCVRWKLKTQRTGPREGDQHPDWKGGRYKLGRYWYVWAKGHPNATKTGYVAEHRLLMSEKIGRPLAPGEVVHHRDGNPENNDLANLELFLTNGAHLAAELAGRIPNWSPEGKAKLEETVRQIAIRRRAKRGD